MLFTILFASAEDGQLQECFVELNLQTLEL